MKKNQTPHNKFSSSGKRYSNVVEMEKDLNPDDRKLHQELEEQLESSRTIDRLVALRAAHGISQRDAASNLNIVQSTLSKWENKTDKEFTVDQLQRYAEMVNHHLILALMPNNVSATDKVKAHAMAIKEHLEGLVQVSIDSPDEGIANGVAQFIGELMLNMSLIAMDSARSLPKKEDGTARIEFNMELNSSSEDTTCGEKDSSGSQGAGAQRRRELAMA